MSKVELDREPWIDVVRTSLRDAEAPVPPAGWERLERALTAPAVPLYRRWWPWAAAAAVLLAAVTWSLRIEPPTPVPAELLAEHSAAEEERLLSAEAPELAHDPAATTASEIPTADIVAEDIAVTEIPAARVGQTFRPTTDGSGADRPAEPVTPHSADHRAGVTAESAAAAATAKENTSEQAADRSTPGTASSRDAAAAADAAVSEGTAVGRTPARPFRPAVRRHRRVSFGIAMSGGITLSDGTGRSGAMLLPASLFMQNDAPVMTDEVASNTIYENGRLWVNSPMEEWSYDHRVPLSFGFTVARELARGVSLASGVHYTLLYSEVTVSPQSARLRQRLHFIGIPVRVEARFLRRSDLSLYAGAGVMAEKCVGGRLGDRTVKIPSVQWSVGASIGAQYALGDHAAIYFEPDLSYYLTRSELRTVRTDSPLTLSLRLGVKLTY